MTEIAVAGGSILMEGDEGEEVPQNVNKVEIYSVQARTWRSASKFYEPDSIGNKYSISYNYPSLYQQTCQIKLEVLPRCRMEIPS